jgi:hypothetical protein
MLKLNFYLISVSVELVSMIHEKFQNFLLAIGEIWVMGFKRFKAIKKQTNKKVQGGSEFWTSPVFKYVVIFILNRT